MAVLQSAKSLSADRQSEVKGINKRVLVCARRKNTHLVLLVKAHYGAP